MICPSKHLAPAHWACHCQQAESFAHPVPPARLPAPAVTKLADRGLYQQEALIAVRRGVIPSQLLLPVIAVLWCRVRKNLT